MKDILIRLMKAIAYPSAIIFIPIGLSKLLGINEKYYIADWCAGAGLLVLFVLVVIGLIGTIKWIITGNSNLF